MQAEQATDAKGIQPMLKQQASVPHLAVRAEQAKEKKQQESACSKNPSKATGQELKSLPRTKHVAYFG